MRWWWREVNGLKGYSGRKTGRHRRWGREVPRGPSRLLESRTLLQVVPPTELGNIRRADAQETMTLNKWPARLLGDAKQHNNRVLFRGSRGNSIRSGVAARSPTQNLFNLGSVRLHFVPSEVTVVILILRAAARTGIKGKIHKSQRVLTVSTDHPLDYHSLPFSAWSVMQAKTKSAVWLYDCNTSYFILIPL